MTLTVNAFFEPLSHQSIDSGLYVEQRVSVVVNTYFLLHLIHLVVLERYAITVPPNKLSGQQPGSPLVGLWESLPMGYHID